jgi:hypothetical protein
MKATIKKAKQSRVTLKDLQSVLLQDSDNNYENEYRLRKAMANIGLTFKSVSQAVIVLNTNTVLQAIND